MTSSLFLSLGGKAESRQVDSCVDCESGRLRMSARACVVALPSSAYCDCLRGAHSQCWAGI
jgi:hypothetical protein